MKNNKINDAIHISKTIEEMLKSNNLKPRFDETNIVESWDRIVGKAISKRTKKVSLRNKVLFVELLSPSMKHDLSYHKTQILDLFKKEFGDDVLGEIIFM